MNKIDKKVKEYLERAMNITDCYNGNINASVEIAKLIQLEEIRNDKVKHKQIHEDVIVSRIIKGD